MKNFSLNDLFGHSAPTNERTFYEQDVNESVRSSRSSFVLPDFIPQTPSTKVRGQKSIRGIHKKPWTEEHRENFKKSIRKSKKFKRALYKNVLKNIYHIRAPDGRMMTTNNLRRFARKHSLHRHALITRKYTQGYTLVKIVKIKNKSHNENTK